jgi:sensor histidine kinase regulating citrate/malate metabolism
MIAVFIFAGEAALIYFWQKYRVLLAERQKHFVEEQQVKAMKKRLEEAENFYGSIRKVRHEMKNHMANIKGLAGAGEYGEIEDYVRRMDETMQELEYKYVTGNAVTDVIINDKCRRAEKVGIRFDADFRYGGEIPVFDLGIILNNLLDNAIEACEKLESGKGFIRLMLKRKKQFLLLEVENSFDGTVPVQTDGGLALPTTKQNTLPGIITEHGIGLENVRDVAERYFGGVNIKVKGDVFHVTVMLQQGEVGEGM